MTSAELGRGTGHNSPTQRDSSSARRQGIRKAPLLFLCATVVAGFVALPSSPTVAPATGTQLSSLTAVAQQPLTYESTIGWVERPAGLATGPDQRIYVADSSRRVSRITVLEPDGSTAFTIGDSEAVLTAPQGVAVDDNGLIYASSIDDRRITVFDADGSFLGIFAQAALEDSDAIPGMLFYRDQRIYVCDVGRHVVLVFDTEGQLLATVGDGPGSGPAQMQYPNGVWADARGTIYVSDTNNNRIHVFGADGELVQTLHPPLNNPRALAGDDAGRLYVASALDHRVLVLGQDGAVLEVIDSAGDTALGFPVGLAVARGQLFVTDRAARAVHVWSIAH